MSSEAAYRALVQRAWTVALDRSDIGPDSDFFALGGDSIAAVIVAEALASELGLAYDALEAIVVALFEGATPSTLAASLSDGSIGASSSGAPAAHSE